MSEQINKIIFTTKEAYDKKVAEGSLDTSAVYAIDASQVATTTEVKATVDNSFDKFGLGLGINKEGAEFYHTPLDLAGMIKDVVKAKYDVPYTGAEHINVGNGTKSLSISHVTNPNTYITAIQDGTEHGFVPFTIDNKLARVIVPDAVDVTREFELKASNVFDTLHDTIKVVNSSESIVIDKLNQFASMIDTEAGVRIEPTYMPSINLYNDRAIYISEESQKNITGFVGYQYKAVIADKSITFNSDDIDAMKRAAKEWINSFYLLIVDRTFSSYVDLGTGEWKDFPASVSATTSKLGDYFNNYALDIDTIRENKVTTTLSALNLNNIDTEANLEITHVSDFEKTEIQSKLPNAECLLLDLSSSTIDTIADKLVEINAATPLKIKAIVVARGSIDDEAFKKLNELTTLQVVFSNSPSDHVKTIDKRVALITTDSYNKTMWVGIKPGDGKSMSIDSSYNNTLTTLYSKIKEKKTVAPPDHL
nr:MAG TPA: hypothetical protein [Bacteriophage sp.]